MAELTLLNMQWQVGFHAAHEGTALVVPDLSHEAAAYYDATLLRNVLDRE